MYIPNSLNINKLQFWDLFHLSLSVALLFKILSPLSLEWLLKIALSVYLLFRISGLIRFYWAYLILATIYLFAVLESALYFRKGLLHNNKNNNIVYYSGEYSKPDDTLGWKMIANSKGVFHTRVYFGDTSFHVQYCSDGQGFRIPCTSCSEATDSAQAKQAIFVGCSFTFGCGLEYPSSLPALFDSKTEEYSIVNQGFNGYGPHQSAIVLDKYLSANKELPRQGFLLYTFINDHLRRVYSASPEVAAEDAKLLVSKKPFWLSTLIEIEKNSLILGALKVTLVPQYPKTEKFYKRFADIINFMAYHYLEKVPDGNFYVLIFPEGGFDAGWIKYCDSRVQVLSIPFPEDYDAQNPEKAGFQLPGDGHPTHRMNNYIIDQLLVEIKQ